MPIRDRLNWTNTGERLDRSKDVPEGKIELPSTNHYGLDRERVILVRCGAEGAERQLRVTTQSRLSPVVSPAEYARLASEGGANELCLRPLSRGEKVARVSRRGGLPALAVLATVVAAVAAFYPGPSEAAKSKAALRDAVRPADPALLSLVATPGAIYETAREGRDDLQVGRAAIATAQTRSRLPDLSRAQTALGRADESSAEVVARARSARRDAATVKAWRAEALKRGGATNSWTDDWAKRLAALAALATAIVATVKAFRDE